MSIRAEGVKTGGWERLRKSVTEKPPSKEDTATRRLQEDAADGARSPAGTRLRLRGGPGKDAESPESSLETRLAAKMEGTATYLPGNLCPFHRKGVRHLAAVPGSDWGGDVHGVQQDLSAHHGEVRGHLFCSLLLSLLPGHHPDWVRKESLVWAGAFGLRSGPLGPSPVYYHKELFICSIYAVGSEWALP